MNRLNEKGSYLLSEPEIAVIVLVNLTTKQNGREVQYRHAICYKKGKIYDSQKKEPFPIKDYEFFNNIYAMYTLTKKIK